MKSNLFFILLVITFNVLVVLSLLGLAFALMNQPIDGALYGGVAMIFIIIAIETFIVYPLLKKLILKTIKKMPL